MIWIELGMLVVLIPLLPFVIRAMASKDVCFTFPNTPYIKYVDRGGKRDENGKWTEGAFVKMIPDVPGFSLSNLRSKDGEFSPGSGDLQFGALNTLLYRSLGVYLYGIYPFRHIREFEIPRHKENLSGTKPSDWITKESPIWTTSLRWTFPRPFVFVGVELADRLTVDLKLIVKFEVVRPYIPVYEFRGDFFTQAGSILQGQVLDRLVEGTGENRLDLSKFITTPKGEVKGLLEHFKHDSDLNRVMIEQVGIKVVGIAINDWTPGNEQIRLAIEQKAIAEHEGDATIAKAQKDMQATIVTAKAYQERVRRESEADAERINVLANARVNYVRNTVAAMTLPGSDPNIVARGAADILEMEAATSENSKLTTLVKDGSKVVVPVGGDKK